MMNNDEKNITLYIEILKSEEELERTIREIRRATAEYIKNNPNLDAEMIAHARINEKIYELLARFRHFVKHHSNNPEFVEHEARRRFDDEHVEESLKKADETLKKSEKTMKLIEQIENNRFLKNMSPVEKMMINRFAEHVNEENNETKHVTLPGQSIFSHALQSKNNEQPTNFLFENAMSSAQ